MFEENPKWTEIGKIIVEIREEIEKDGKDETVFIVTRDERTSRQINDFLSSGMYTNTFQIVNGKVKCEFVCPTSVLGHVPSSKGIHFWDKKIKLFNPNPVNLVFYQHTLLLCLMFAAGFLLGSVRG